MDTAEVVEDILAHHGVLGMHWGIRRDRSSRVSVGKKRIGKGIKTTGGYGHPAHSDAVRTAKIGQVGKKSGIKALSDDELKTYTSRLNLEQNAKRLTYETANPGRKFVLGLLRQTGKRTTDDISGSASIALGKKLRRAATAAAVAAA